MLFTILFLAFLSSTIHYFYFKDTMNVDSNKNSSEEINENKENENCKNIKNDGITNEKNKERSFQDKEKKL